MQFLPSIYAWEHIFSLKKGAFWDYFSCFCGTSKYIFDNFTCWSWTIVQAEGANIFHQKFCLQFNRCIGWHSLVCFHNVVCIWHIWHLGTFYLGTFYLCTLCLATLCLSNVFQCVCSFLVLARNLFPLANPHVIKLFPLSKPPIIDFFPTQQTPSLNYPINFFPACITSLTRIHLFQESSHQAARFTNSKILLRRSRAFF